MEELKMTNSKKMAMEQLEIVAGGTYPQSMEVANFLQKAGYRGLFKGAKVNFDHLRKAVNSLGFECNDRGGFFDQNTYVNKLTGRVYTHEEFKIALKVKFPRVA
jgi:hypothetical protein